MIRKFLYEDEGTVAYAQQNTQPPLYIQGIDHFLPVCHGGGHGNKVVPWPPPFYCHAQAFAYRALFVFDRIMRAH